MAARSGNAAKGETRLGSATKTIQGGLYIKSGKPLQNAWIGLDTVAANGTRTVVYIWPNSSGQWRTALTLPANMETGGTLIGSQV